MNKNAYSTIDLSAQMGIKMLNNENKKLAEQKDLKVGSLSSENGDGQDIDALIALLDGYTEAGDSRIKVDVVEGRGEMIARQYHHGRCDVGSPWACGAAFDVLE